MTASNPTTLAQRLHASAAGTYPAEAAATVITRTINGRFLDKLDAAITDHPSIGRAFLDWEKALEISTPFSSGERRLIRLAASLATDNHPTNVGDALSGLDETNADIVLDALARCLRVTR